MLIRASSSRQHASTRTQAGGYILLATLAIVLVMTLLASMIAVTTARALEDRRHADDKLQATLDAVSTQSTVFYLLSTQRQTFAGLTVDDRLVMSADEAFDQKDFSTAISLVPAGNEIHLDGSAYAGLGDIRFALQDDRGRVNVNWLQPRFLIGFLNALGIPANDVAPLLAKLKDYQDEDNLYRLNGAEAADYRKAKMDPPSNRTLVTPLELRRVMGWREALAKFSDTQILEAISISRNPQINVNTASLPVLRMIPGLEEDTAQRVLARRRQTVFTGVAEFLRYTGLFMDDEEQTVISLYPGGTGTLELWSPKLGALRHVHWSLTPVDDRGRPWRSQYAVVLPLPESLDAAPPEKPGTKVFDDTLPAKQ